MLPHNESHYRVRRLHEDEMIDPKQLTEYIIRPVLKDIELWSEPAERLVLGTACQESGCGHWLHQVGGGPALGIFQMEPASHDDIWTNFLKFHPELVTKVLRWCVNLNHGANEMVFNLAYATIMCRLLYRRVAESIPDTLMGQAEYWKNHYNTALGAGTVEQYIANWNRFNAGMV